MPDALAAPAALRATKKSTQASHHRYAASTGIPCAMVLTLLRALPGVHDRLVTVACGIIIRKLSASPGAPGSHDFAVRFSALRLNAPPRPSHPASNTRDDREAPLWRKQDAGREA